MIDASCLFVFAFLPALLLYCLTKNFSSETSRWVRAIAHFAISFYLIVGVYAIATKATANNEEYSIQSSTEYAVTITAAHIPESEFPNSKLIYVDEENDRAIYVNLDYRPIELSNNVNVIFGDGLKGIVRDSNNLQMVIEPEEPDAIVKGLSGSIVYFDSKPIGFISSLIEGGRLLGIYF